MNRKRILPAIALSAAGIAVGLVAAAVAAAPRVTAFSPLGGSEHIPATSPLLITFSRSMDPASVEERLSIEPRTAGDWSWVGSRASFQPAVPWPPGATSTVG